MKLFSLIILSLVTISSCAIGPKYSKPTDYTSKARPLLVTYSPLLRECYIKELNRTGKNISGSVIFKINIKENGKVELVKLIDDTLNNKRIKGCFVKTIHQIKFPKHSGPGIKQINQPFKFNPPRRK